jgi:CspA family cold shock protein
MSLSHHRRNHATSQDVTTNADRLRLRLAMNAGSARFVAYSRGARHGDGHREMVQCNSAVERAGLHDLHEGQKIAYEVVADRRTGKSSADNLKPA